MGKTTSQTIDEIFDHLETLVDNGVSDLHAYTKAGIMERTGLEDKDTVSKALEKLKESEDIECKRIGVLVYLPQSNQAKVVYKRLADHGYETMRPYVSVLLGMGVAYLFMVGSGGPASDTPFGAWQDGFANAAFLGLAFGALIQKLLTKLTHWRLRSEDAYATIIQLTAISLLAAGLLVGVYHLITSHFGKEFEPSVIVGLVSMVFAITIGYAAYLRSKGTNTTEDGVAVPE